MIARTRRLRISKLGPLVLAFAACSPRGAPAGFASQSAAGARTEARKSCRYEVTAVRPTAVLDVVAHCAGSPTSGFKGDPLLAPFTTDVRDDRGVLLPGNGARFTVPPSDDVTIRYRVDLDAAARERHDADTALAVGRSLVAPLSSYVLAPEPPIGSALVTVRPAAGTEFVTELEQKGSDFSLGLHEIHASTYGVFGLFERTVLELPGVHGSSRLDVVSLDGRFSVPRVERETWVRKRAEAVAMYYGGFPVRRAGVALTPVAGSGVAFGKVLSAGGSTIALFVGANASPAELASDWVLVHEMFHLGFPSFVGEGKWLDEGLATYVEPLIRARAGMLTEEEGWFEVVRGMDLGVKLCETTGLEHPGGDFRSIYWGGAVIALLADVEARRRTNGETGLEDALRKGVARGWDASHVLPLADTLRAIDDTFGSDILTGLAARYADHGNPLRLEPVLTELGVERREKGVLLHDDAPLAAVRRTIMYGDAARRPDLGVRRRP